MSPRTGRPKAENPKSAHFTIRLSHDENEELEAYCEEHGESKAEVARKGIRMVLDKDENK